MKKYMSDPSTGQYVCMLDVSGNNQINMDLIPHDEEPSTPNDYWSGYGWVTPPPKPEGIWYTFDYVSKQWIDPRSLDDVKTQKWEEIKAQRDQLEFGGFVFDGHLYDSDQVSQSRIMGAAAAGIDQIWTLADNSTVELTASQLQQLYAALQAHIAGVHERGRIARQLILDAQTKDQVEAIQL